jgi:hypothetical protein
MQAATDRLDALTDGEDSIVGMNDMALAFVGFDITRDELEQLAPALVEPYGETIMDASMEFVEAEGEFESFQAGMRYGLAVRRTLVGVFIYGLLAGELHRQRAHERQRSHDAWDGHPPDIGLGDPNE